MEMEILKTHFELKGTKFWKFVTPKVLKKMRVYKTDIFKNIYPSKKFNTFKDYNIPHKLNELQIHHIGLLYWQHSDENTKIAKEFRKEYKKLSNEIFKQNKTLKTLKDKYKNQIPHIIFGVSSKFTKTDIEFFVSPKWQKSTIDEKIKYTNGVKKVLGEGIGWIPAPKTIKSIVKNKT